MTIEKKFASLKGIPFVETLTLSEKFAWYKKSDKNWCKNPEVGALLVDALNKSDGIEFIQEDLGIPENYIEPVKPEDFISMNDDYHSGLI